MLRTEYKSGDEAVSDVLRHVMLILMTVFTVPEERIHEIVSDVPSQNIQNAVLLSRLRKVKIGFK